MGAIKQANTKRRPRVVLMLGQRRRRWTSINTIRGRRLALGFVQWPVIGRDGVPNQWLSKYLDQTRSG